MLGRVASASVVTTASVPGYCLRFNKNGQDGSAKANMCYTGKSSDAIWGAVYAMDTAEKPVLDDIEGSEYKTHFLDINTRRGDSLQVYAYIAEQDVSGKNLQPHTWYRDLVFEGAKSHNFPGVYCVKIAAVEAIEDMDKQRDAINRYGVL